MRDLVRDIYTFVITMTTACGSYVAGHYDKIFASALSLGGLLFLIWRWRKAAQSQLCDKINCSRRHRPND